MEQIKDESATIEVFDNDISMYLKQFCDRNNIKDLRKESQSVWNASLRYVRRYVFNTKDKLKSKELNIVNNNNIKSTFNAYDYDLVNDVCDIYIDLCFLYDKEVSIIGFSNLTGIDTETINNWGNENTKLSTASFGVYKKLRDFREESLSDKLATGNKNPVGILAILNRHYQWNLPGVSKEQSTIKVLPAEQLPQLEVDTAPKALPNTQET
ncbi:MAG: hypothetical protein ACLRZ9_05715 [Eubacterium sp.]